MVEYADGRRAVICNSRKAFQVTRPVARCSDYDDKASASEWEMQKIAWTLNTDKSGKVLGFASPKKDK